MFCDWLWGPQLSTLCVHSACSVCLYRVRTCEHVLSQVAWQRVVFLGSLILVLPNVSNRLPGATAAHHRPAMTAIKWDKCCSKFLWRCFSNLGGQHSTNGGFGHLLWKHISGGTCCPLGELLLISPHPVWIRVAPGDSCLLHWENTLRLQA